MKLTLQNNDGNDDETNGKPKGKPSYDPRFLAQQKHRRAEREAIWKLLVAYLSKLDPAILAMIRFRWETGIDNQIHVGSWASIWPVLDAARQIPGWCPKCIVIFGIWNASPPEDLEELSPPPEDLLGLLNDYLVYVITLELIALLNKSKTAAEYRKRFEDVMRWILAHRGNFGFFAANPEGVELTHDDIDAIKIVAQKAKDELPPLIKNIIVGLENRVFVFFPDPEKGTSAWWNFIVFLLAYSRLPADMITEFNNYFFHIHVPK